MTGGITKENCANSCEENADCTVWQHSKQTCLLFKKCNEFVPLTSADAADIYACNEGQPEPGE